MKWLNGYRIRFVLFGFVAAVVLAAGGRAKADFVFGTPENLGPTFNTSSEDSAPSISADGLSLYFQSPRPGGYGSYDLYVATRQSTQDDWGPAVNLGWTVNTASDEGMPSISADGLSLYFESFTRPGGLGSWDLWMTTRPTKADQWGIPVNLSGINSPTDDICPSISSDGLSLYFASNRAGGSGSSDLWVVKRATLSDPWGPPANLGSAVNSSTFDLWPNISADGLALFFGSGRPPSLVPDDIWVTTRGTVADPWGPPVSLGPRVNLSAADDDCPSISADGRTLYFTSNRPGGYGGYDLWQAPIIPIVDFNGDGKVDIQDLLRLIESWGKDDPSVDMGPMPWGNGKIDEKDLEVLMRYWGQEAYNPALIAHWKLDEASGIVAADSAGANDATLVGDPIWQSGGGKKAGALQLDGVNDCLETPPILIPSVGPFTVFAWIKGGAPGQVIVSQMKGANWLKAATPRGELMTELKAQRGGPLTSSAVITDGAWHRVGLVWDNGNRILYVDDVEVARDTQTSLGASAGGLYIGAASIPTPGTFWSGLIDDVRIYDRAVKP